MKIIDSRVGMPPKAWRRRALLSRIADQVDLSYLAVDSLEDNRLVRFIMRGVRKAAEKGNLPRVIDLSKMDICDADAIALGDILLDHGSRLEGLLVRLQRFEDVEMTESSLLALTEPLLEGRCPHLHKLHVDVGTELTYTAWDKVNHLLSSGKCRGLTELQLFMAHNRQPGVGVTGLATALQRRFCTNLRSLNLNTCDITSGAASALKRALKSGCCPRLEALAISCNPPGRGVVTSIAGLIEEGGLTNLKRLKFCNIGVSRHDAEALARAISSGKCHRLQALNLSLNNEVGDKAAVAIIKALQTGQCHDVCDLNLREISMGKEGAKALVEAMEAWPKMECIKFSGPQLPSKFVTNLKAGVWPSLRELSIVEVSITDAVACRMAKALEEGCCPKLEMLGVRRMTAVNWKEVMAKRSGKKVKLDHIREDDKVIAEMMWVRPRRHDDEGSVGEYSGSDDDDEDDFESDEEDDYSDYYGEDAYRDGYAMHRYNAWRHRRDGSDDDDDNDECIIS